MQQRCGIFGSTSAKPAAGLRTTLQELRFQRGFRLLRRASIGPCLALRTVSIDVFRAAVLSFVLTLVAGPSASLLCALWCHPEAVTTGPCEHSNPTSTPNVTANDDCPDVATIATVFVREDVRRGTSAAQAHHAVDPAPFLFGPPPNHAGSVAESGRRVPLAAPRLVLVLRI